MSPQLPVDISLSDPTLAADATVPSRLPRSSTFSLLPSRTTRHPISRRARRTKEDSRRPPTLSPTPIRSLPPSEKRTGATPSAPSHPGLCCVHSPAPNLPATCPRRKGRARTWTLDPSSVGRPLYRLCPSREEDSGDARTSSLMGATAGGSGGYLLSSRDCSPRNRALLRRQQIYGIAVSSLLPTVRAGIDEMNRRTARIRPLASPSSEWRTTGQTRQVSRRVPHLLQPIRPLYLPTSHGSARLSPPGLARWIRLPVRIGRDRRAGCRGEQSWTRDDTGRRRERGGGGSEDERDLREGNGVGTRG